MTGPRVAAIVAAKDAAATIGRAVASALAEPEVAQVIVVDDGSADATAAAAHAADDGSGRLLVERLPRNLGPSAARNRALALVEAPFFAILDADDMLLPGRFARLFAVPGWDVIGDNLLFVADGTDLDAVAVPRTPGRHRALDLAGMIEGCTLGRSPTRSQLGFLKPVIRTSLLGGTGPGGADLRYDERVRLGEDFLLYAELLRRGAAFALLESPGYLAVERATSLSARHGAEDLRALLVAERAFAQLLPAGSAEARAMAGRTAETHRKHALRAFLAVRRARGMAAALAWLARRPPEWRPVTADLLRDKLDTARRRIAAAPAAPQPPRLLIGADSPLWH